MKLLICAATMEELNTFWPEEEPVFTPRGECDDTGWLCTGVGIPAALGALLTALPQPCPELVMQIGIAGAYPHSGLKIGDIVICESEQYGDIGFELPTPPGFLPLRSTPFTQSLYNREIPLSLPAEWIYHPNVRIVKGCTVNNCTGTEFTGELREELYGTQVESMEGAAAAQAGEICRIPVCEIRAISNIASTRDMRPENIVHSLNNLRSYLQACKGCQLSQS